MRISYNWLQEYFDEKLPRAEDLSEVLTMHAFEVESVEKTEGDVVFDIKVLPDRSHDCLSHIGIAREISFLTGLTLKENLKNPKEITAPESNVVRVEVEDEKKCRRISLLVIEDIEVKESPDWLKASLGAMGQRSVNNVVDATNFVMFNMGQPLHAYDRDLLKEDGVWKIVVRNAKSGENLTALDNKEYILDEEDLLIVDGNTNLPLGIAGIKGGKACEISSKTKHIILEAANFDSISVRRTAKKLSLRTDASVRFENEITPDLTLRALKEVSDLIFSIAKTDKTQVEGLADVYPGRSNLYKAGFSLSELNDILGINISQSEVESILNRRGYEWERVEPRAGFVETAKSLVGTKYKFGASIIKDAPKEFDCSGLVAFCAVKVGIALPRISVDQYVFCDSIIDAEIKPGDLVFALTEDSPSPYFESKEWMSGTKIEEGVDHVGIMVSQNEVLHTSRYNQDGAIIEPLDDFLKNRESRGFRRVPYIDVEKRFVITIPHERLDLRIKEDLIEEIGRCYGYQKINPVAVAAVSIAEPTKEQYCERLVKNFFVERGFSEVLTYSFQEEGQSELENPLASDKKFLRDSLVTGIKSSFANNLRNKDLLGLSQIKLFEMGSVFTKEGENTSLAFAIEKTKGGDSAEEVTKSLETLLGIKVNFSEDDGFYETNFSSLIEGSDKKLELLSPAVGSGARFKTYSQYPFILRDIAVFVPEGGDESEIITTIREGAGELFVNHRLFDVFTKDFPEGKKTSYAYRLVFQSLNKTLTDDEINLIMDEVTKKINKKDGWQVR